MDDAEAWALEERFWTGRAPAFDKLLDPACLMAFPGKGVMRAADVLESLAGAPRWASVEMAERHVGRPAPVLIVLAYKACGLRDGAAPYTAHCTSTYRRDGGRWLLVQHQQTLA